MNKERKRMKKIHGENGLELNVAKKCVRCFRGPPTNGSVGLSIISQMMLWLRSIRVVCAESVRDANRNSDLPYKCFIHFVHPFPFSGICCLEEKAKKNTFFANIGRRGRQQKNRI